MEVALIPPARVVHTCDNRPFQMMVPDLAYPADYKTVYTRYGLDYKYFVIMDNGAYETEAKEDGFLLDMAYRYRVDEVIAPDTLRDKDRSLKQLDSFMTLWRHPSMKHRRPEKVMAAVQGQTMEECKQYVREVSANQPLVETLGIPKHLPETLDYPHARLDLTNWIYGAYPGVWDIHFLGFVSALETLAAAKLLKVRSIDTSIPYVAARENDSLQRCRETGVYPDRQRWYANMWANSAPPFDLINSNIRALDNWAEASTAVKVVPE